MAVLLRPARPDDARALTAIARAAKAHWPYPTSALDAWRGQLSVSARELAEHPCIVAERDGEPVGFCLATLDPPAVADLWIRPDAMGAGTGRRLLARVAELARGRGIAALAIDADPHVAGFYERAGATRTGAVPAPIEGEPERVRPQYSLDLRATLPGAPPVPISARRR